MVSKALKEKLYDIFQYVPDTQITKSIRKYKDNDIEIDSLVIGNKEIVTWLESEISTVPCCCAKQGVTSFEPKDKPSTDDKTLPEIPYNDVEGLSVELVGLRKKGETCGHVREASSCGDISDGLKYKNITCGNRTCSFCYESWISRAVDSVAERFEVIEELYEKLPRFDKKNVDNESTQKGFKKLGKRKHVTFSPPQEWAKERFESGISGIRYMRTKLNKVLKEAGMRGCSTVFHPFRVTEEYKDKFKAAVKRGYPKSKGVWTFLRENGFLGYEYYNESFYLAPHFHTIGYGWLERSDKFNKNTKFKIGKYKGQGWVYDNHGYRDKPEDLRKTLFYLLSHAAVIGEKSSSGRYPIQSVSHMGIMGYKHMSMREVVEKEIATCDQCGDPLYELYPYSYSDKKVVKDGKETYVPVFEGRSLTESLDAEVYDYISHRFYSIKGYPEVKVERVNDSVERNAINLKDLECKDKPPPIIQNPVSDKSDKNQEFRHPNGIEIPSI